MQYRDIHTLKGAFNKKCTLAYYNESRNDNLTLGLSCTYDKRTFNLKTLELAHENHTEKYNINRNTDINPIKLDEMKECIAVFLEKHGFKPSDKVVLVTLLDEKTLNNLKFIRNFDVFKTNNGSIEFYKNKNKKIDIAIFDLYGWVEDGLNNKKQSARFYFEVSEQLRNHMGNTYNIDILNNPTPAKCGINAFRKNYIKLDNPILPPEHSVRMQALLSNWGGVSIAFRRGIFKGNFNYYDAKSMYASCAVGMAELPLKNDWIRVYDIEDLVRMKGGITTVRFKFPNTEKYPCLPISLTNFGTKNWERTINRKKIFYPLEGMSSCTSYEIGLALEKGAKLELVKNNESEPYAYGYEKGDSKFPRFLREMRFKKEMYSNEKENWSKAKAFSKVYKNLANFSIGKLLSKFSIYTNSFYPEWNTLIIGKSREINFRAFEKTSSYIGTTDSTITEMGLGNDFTIDGIQYELKKTGNELGILRNKFYYLKDNNKIVHSAHLGLSLLPEQEYLIEQYVKEGLKYPYIHHSLPQILNSEQMNRAKISNLKFSQQLKTYWDNQRVLLPNGSTKPLKDESELKKQIWDKMGYYNKIDRIYGKELKGKNLTVSQKEFKKELWERIKNE